MCFASKEEWVGWEKTNNEFNNKTKKNTFKTHLPYAFILGKVLIGIKNCGQL